MSISIMCISLRDADKVRDTFGMYWKIMSWEYG